MRIVRPVCHFEDSFPFIRLSGMISHCGDGVHVCSIASRLCARHSACYSDIKGFDGFRRLFARHSACQSLG